HPFNFSPIGAMALFSGAQFRDKRLAFLVPLVPMFLADLVSGLHVLIPFVYGSLAVSVCLGFWVRRHRWPGRVLVAVLMCAVCFFLVTNFGVWLLLGTYAPTASGLAICYMAAIPYFQNTLLSDLLFSGLLFGGLALTESGFPKVRESVEVSSAA